MASEIIWNEFIATANYEGLLDADLLISTDSSITTDSRFKNISYLIYDLTSVREWMVESDTIRTLCKLNAKRYRANPNFKIAVVSNEPVAKGLLNIYVSYLEVYSDIDEFWEIKLFSNIDEALEWAKGH